MRAVPYWRPPDCDSCVIYFQRSAIDSIRVQRVDNLRTGALVGAFAVIVTAFIVVADAMERHLQ